jgi:hypothetical protein
MNTTSASSTSILVREIAEQFPRITGCVSVAQSDDGPRRIHDIRAPLLNIEQTPTYLGQTVSGAPRSMARDYEAELARLKVEEKRGKLISSDIARKVLFEAGRVVRVGLEDVTSQLAPDLAAESDIGQTERILKTRFDRLLNSMADQIKNLNESLFENQDEGGQEVRDA